MCHSSELLIKLISKKKINLNRADSKINLKTCAAIIGNNDYFQLLFKAPTCMA